MRSFFFHYNKPASQRRGKPTITVHWKGACHLVDNIIAMIPTKGRIRKSQPRFVMAGQARSLKIVQGIAYLV